MLVIFKMARYTIYYKDIEHAFTFIFTLVASGNIVIWTKDTDNEFFNLTKEDDIVISFKNGNKSLYEIYKLLMTHVKYEDSDIKFENVTRVGDPQSDYNSLSKWGSLDQLIKDLKKIDR